MAKTGKTEQAANYCLIAANGFIKEYKKEENDQGTPNVYFATEEDVLNEEVINTRTRGVNKGIMKLVKTQKHLYHLEDLYENIRQRKTSKVFESEVKFVSDNLKAADIIKKEKDSSTVETMINSFEDNKSNAKINAVRLGYVLPVFNGFIQYTKLINAKQLKNGGDFIKQEFEARGIIDKLNLIMQKKER